MKDEDKATSESSPTRKKKKKKRSRAQAAVAAPPPPPPKANNTNAILFAVVALAAGGAGGWFLRDAKAAEDVSPTPDTGGAAAAGSAGVCGDWAQKVCEGVGEENEACGQAKAAAGLLPEGACGSALADLPATVEKAKAARSTCDQLVEKACADLGKETETCKLVAAKTASFPASQCKQMLENYDKVLGELKQMEKQNAPLEPADAAKIAAGDIPSFGPKDAALTVVEFSDFECPYCARAAETMKALKEKYGDKVRFVFRQYPLSFHKKAQLVAEASLAAHAQGKFWEFHDKVFENQQNIERENLEGYAKDVGLDMAKFKAALDDKTFEQTVKDDFKLGSDVGVGGTPSFFVGAKRVSEPSVEAISAMIDEQLK